MTATRSIAIAQLNFTVGAIVHNQQKILNAIQQAISQNAELIIFPELAMTGYPPEDLLLRQDFYIQLDQALQKIIAHSLKIDIVIGYPEQQGDTLFNTAAWLSKGKIVAKYHKQKLPNYGVFDEQRYFTPGETTTIVEWNNKRIGLLVCEDIWYPTPIQAIKQQGADLVIVINASPFAERKSAERQVLLKKRAEETSLPIIYANLIGGQDDLLFDGDSMAINADQTIAFQASAFNEALYLIEWNSESSDFVQQPLPQKNRLATIYQGLVTGVRDYIEKNKFPGAIIGLSGGIDSALTLAIAVDALGADRVQAVMMPSPYTALMSEEDAEKQARLLKVNYSKLMITPIFETFLTTLAPAFENLAQDKTEENIQARIRGSLLMALSNKSGRLVLSTGNKSEMAVGYATLYGDMVGGYCVLKDVYKTLVYALADYRNSIDPVIPQRVITRPPSAELAPNQIDQDSLPPYDLLDKIIAHFVEHDLSIEDIVLEGFNLYTVETVIDLIQKNEYKRRQAPPGPRITEKAFGRNRRYPITSGFNNR